ncbi:MULTISPECIES: hypothetical protein [unclassified Wolbachia]|uniref:hypothetical protein n=1 Tax=unclassified Wolbachia TaxID=2640676 RepID=UPI0022309121|nr:hypothetical protein [Wolbachia endosymbiont (group A) of Apoderus coryli]
MTLASSFLYKFTKSASFYNAKPILTKPNALLAIKFPGSQCLGTEMTTKGYLDDREGCWNEGFSNCR